MVKQQSKPGAGGAEDHPPVIRARKSSKRRKRLFRSQALRMLSQEQSEVQPGTETTTTSSSSGNKSKDGGGTADTLDPGSVAGGSGGSGSVTPVHHNGTEEFLSTGRTGRRNAMPDILGEHAETGTADLPDKLGALTTDPGGSSQASSQAGPSSEQQYAG